MADDKQHFDAGLEVRHAMFGRAGGQQQIDDATPFTAPFQDMLTRYCFGEVWTRPLLDRKTRSMLTLAILAVIAKPNQLRTHVRGAIANGVSPEEIREVLMHVMIYGGVPAAADSMNHAAEVLKDMGLDGK